MDDKLQLFYNSLTANPNIKGLPGDYDIFRTTLTDPAKSELFYNSLKANQNIKGLPDSYDEFVSGLALRSGGITPKEPEQTEQPEQQRPGFFEGLGKKFASSIYGAGEGITEAPQFGEAVKQLGVKTMADAYINRLVKKGKITAEQAEAEKKRTDTYIPKIDFLGIPHKAGTELPGTKMADSKANKWLSETSDRLSKEGERYDKRVVDYLKAGQFGKALGAEVYSITESLAPTLLAAAGGPVGAGALGVMAGAETYDEVKDREDMQEAAKVIDGVGTMVFEALFEYFGTAEMTKVLKGIYAKNTKGQAEDIIKNTVGGLISKAYKRFGVWFAPVHEGLSEGLTTLGQNLTAKYTGEDPGRRIFDNFIESILVGMGMGGLFAGTEKGLEKLAKKIQGSKEGQPLDQGPAPIGELKVPHTQEEAVELINNIGRDFKFGDTPLEEDPNPVVSFGLTKLGQKVILKKEGGIKGDDFFIAFDLETNEPLIIKARDIQERKDVPYQEWVNNEIKNYNIVKAEGDRMTSQMEAPVQEGQEITIKDKNFYVSQVTPEGIALNEIDEEGNITGAVLQVAPDQYGSVFGMDEGIQEDDNLPENRLPAAPEAQAPQTARTLTVGKTNYQAIPDETGVLTIDQVFTDETTAKNTLKALEKGYPKAAFSLQKTEFEDFLTPDEYKITVQPRKKPVIQQPVQQQAKPEEPQVETIPIESVVNPEFESQSIGDRTNRVRTLLTNATGLKFQPNLQLSTIIGILKSDQSASERFKRFVNANPVEVATAPDGTRQIVKGQEVAYVLNQLGITDMPFKEVEYREPEAQAVPEAPKEKQLSDYPEDFQQFVNDVLIIVPDLFAVKLRGLSNDQRRQAANDIKEGKISEASKRALDELQIMFQSGGITVWDKGSRTAVDISRDEIQAELDKIRAEKNGDILDNYSYLDADELLAQGLITKKEYDEITDYIQGELESQSDYEQYLDAELSGTEKGSEEESGEVTAGTEPEREITPSITPDETAPEEVKQKAGEVEKKTSADLTKANAEVDTQPTEAQKKAGNYKKGHLSVQGLDISIENPAMSVRSGTDKAGKKWSVMLNNSYGYFRRTKGKDGDQVDVFLGDNLDSDAVYVVDQVDPETGLFDEHKVMLGFISAQDAQDNYLANYEPGWKGLGSISKMAIDQFKDWLGNGTRTRKPVDGNVPVKPAEKPVKAPSLNLSTIIERGKELNEARRQFRYDSKEYKDANDELARNYGFENADASIPYKENWKNSEDVITFPPEKKGHVSMNSIRVAQSPNDIWFSSFNLNIGNGGTGSAPSIYDTPFTTKEEAIADALKDYIKEANKRLDNKNESNAAITYAQKVIDLAKEELSKIGKPTNQDQSQGTRENTPRSDQGNAVRTGPVEGSPKESTRPTGEQINKPEFAGEVLDKKPGSKEYRYKMNARPFDIGTYPKEGFVKADNDPSGGYQILTYNRKLTEKERNHWSFLPLTEVDDIKGKNYEDKDGEFFVDLEWMPNYSGADVSVFDNKNQLVEKPYFMSTNDILKNIESGYWTEKKDNLIVKSPEGKAEFTFISDNPMRQGKALAALSKSTKYQGRIMKIYEFIESLEPGLKIETAKIYRSKSEKGYTDKLVIGDHIVFYKAEQDYYTYLQNGGMSYSEHLKKEAEAKRIQDQKDAERRDKEREERAKSQIQQQKEYRAIQDAIYSRILSGEINRDQFIQENTQRMSDAIKQLEGRKQTIEVKRQLMVDKSNLESRIRSIGNQYDIVKKLYKLDDGTVVKKYDYQIGDDVIVNAWNKSTQTKIEGLRENPDGSTTYIVEKHDDIPNQYLGYESIEPSKLTKSKEVTKQEQQSSLSPIQQKQIDKINKEYSELIAKKEAAIVQAEKDMREALLKADNRNGLFGDTNPVEKDEIIKRDEQGFTYDEATRAAVRKPFEEKMAELRKEIEELKLEQKGKIESVIKQQDLFSDTPAEPAESKPIDKESLPKHEDFGQKIGGARKDMEITRKVRDTDSLPAWRRKYHYANADGTLNLGVPVDTSKPFIVQWAKDIDSWAGKRTVYRPVTTIDTRETKVFNSEEEAEAYIPIYEVWKQNFRVRKSGDNYVITKTSSTNKVIEYATFSTEEEANTYMYSTEGATSLLNHKREDFSIPALDKVERTGKDWRKGKDISTEEFMNTFGFRGGEFGNWVKPEERRVMLNAAYDSFMDLAELIGVPPRSLSLSGELSIAFGARGVKGAAAHFEPDRAVINLTRMNGAGSLAHEWAHALDNYFGLQAAKKDYSRNDKGEVKAGRVMRTEAGLLAIQGMRKALSEKFDKIIEATQEKSVTRKMGIDEKQLAFDKFQKSVKREADDLIKKFTNGVRRYQYNRKTKQREDVVIKATPDQIKKAKNIVDKIIAGEGTKPTWERIPGSKGMGKYSYISPETLALEELHKAVFGKTGLDRDGNGFYNLGYYGDRMYRAKETLDKALAGESETLNVPTDFLKTSREFDKSRANPYWSTKIEMFARAFEYFIESKLLDQNVRADYLQYDKAPVYDAVYGKNPYPQGEERAELNRLFEKFFKEVRVKTDENNASLLYDKAEKYIKKNKVYSQARPLQDFPEGVSYLSERSGGSLSGQLNLFGESDYTPTADDGNVTYVERLISERGVTFLGDKLTGPPTIRTSADIAFLFKNLESATSENAFAVLISETGEYKVLYLGTGGTTGVIIDSKLIIAAAKEFGAKRVVVVHNHPSGNLKPSEADKSFDLNIRRALTPMNIDADPSVIIDLDSGMFTVFTGFNTDVKSYNKEDYGTDVPVEDKTIYQFEKKKLYVPASERTAVKNSADIAEYLSKMKRGTTPKLHVMILDRSLHINKYLLYDETISNEELISGLLYEVGKHGEMVALASNTHMSRGLLVDLAAKLKTIDSDIIDFIQIKQGDDIINNYMSYADLGYLSEPDIEYGGKPDAKFRIIGEQGAQNIEGLIDNLVTAKEMEAANKDAKTIFLATGWQRGKDNLWRHETRDIELRKGVDFISKLKPQNEAYTEEIPITDIVEDEELFNLYPQLNDVKLIFYNYGSHPELTKAGAFTDFKKKVISIGTENLARTKQSGYNFPVRTLQAKSSPLSNFMEARPTYAYDRTSFKSVLSHEIQHYIQRIEDFGEGSAMVAGVQGSRGDMDYWGAVGEVEARNVQRRINYSPEIRRSKMLRDTEDVSRDQQIILRDQIEQQYNTPFRISDNLYFSPVERALGAIKQDKATPQQWKAMFLKNGAKQAELDWMGWDEFANDKRVITKAKIQDWIDQNKIRVEEVQKGGFQWKGNDLIVGGKVVANLIHNEDGTWSYQSDFSEGEEAWETKLDAQKEAEEAIIGDAYSPNATKYSQYTLPGGENYKELLLTMPTNHKSYSLIDVKTDEVLQTSNDYEELVDRRNELGGELVVLENDESKGVTFKSSHFNEPNILAHVRFNTRRTQDGKNILFIEEIQSDWAQEGKKKGYKSAKDKLFKDLAAKGIFQDTKSTIETSFIDKEGNHIYHPNSNVPQKASPEQDAAIDEFFKEYQNISNASIPDMPYKKTDQWAGLALRRMIRYAIDNGFDAVAWTTGEMQAERYDLSKQVDEIWIQEPPKSPGSFGIIGYKGDEILFTENVPQEKLADYVGKEIADKYQKGEKNKDQNNLMVFKGKDLKVGGSGMIGFYDNILPSIANKLGKKFGSQVSKEEVETSRSAATFKKQPDGMVAVFDIDDNLLGTFATQGDADEFAKRRNTVTVHSLPITDAMFDSYRQGIPLFKRAQRLTGESLLFEVVNTPSRESWENEVRDKVKILADSLNTKIEVISNRGQLPERIQRQALRQGITTQKRISGVYDPQTDTVYVLLDDIRATGTIRGIEEVTKTVLHEVVAHKGLRSLLGEEEYNKFLDDLYWDIPQIDRSFLMDQYNTSDHRTISEEYLGMMAEQNVNPTLFQKILAQIRQILRKLFKVNYTENDIHDMLRRSRENLNKPKASDYTSAQEYLEATDKYEKAKFRIAQAYNKNIVDQAAEVYKEKEARRTIKETKQGIREYIQDLNLPIRKFEEEVLKRGGKQDNESKPYRDTSLSFGRHEKLYNDFFDQKMKPVLNSVAKIKKSGIPGENILPYIISKHAIERNKAFREREMNEFVESNPDATPDKIRDFEESIRNKDYSGVMLFDNEGKYSNPDELAKDIAREFESQVEDKNLIDDLWANLRAANTAILDTWEAGQQISAEQKQEYLDKFKYFVPLRGWRHGAAKELTYTRGQGFSNSLRKAQGRKSLADNPLAYILNVQFQAISEQVTNEVNNSMLNLIIRNLGNNEIHEMATLKKLYYLKVNLPDGSYEWEPTLTRPTSEQFASGDARTKIFREHERLRAPSQAREHEVVVHKPGGDMVMIFKGNNLPVAQSLNKQNYMYRTIFGNIHDAREVNKAMTLLGDINNMLKAAYTSWNVVFPFTNFMRDFQEASITQAIKQGSGLKVIRNYKHAFPAIIRHLAGKPYLNNPIDKRLDEFYKVGGATGYTHLKTPEEIEKDINKEIKRMVRAGTIKGDTANSARKFLVGIEYWNRIFEDATRFSVYLASLAAGNTKEDAAYDAKEASVNFNRKGKGSKAWDAYFAFFNVAIQSMQKNFALAKNHTGKFTAVAMSFVTIGFLEAMMNALFDDDDETSYYNINPYMRQNYLVIPNIPAILKGEVKGDKYLSIPLPQFWRGFKSMGAIGFDIATKRMTIKDGTMQALGNFGSALLPVDIGGFWKSGEFSFAPIVPTVIKPIAEVLENRNYMGYAIKNEPFTKEHEKELARAGLGKKNVNPAAKFITDMLFRWGGGDSKYKYYFDSYKGKSRKVPGILDINPSTLEHLFKGYTGGTGAVFSDMMTTISQTLDPEQEIDYRNAPFINKFLRKIPESRWNKIARYYELRDDAKITNALSSNYFKEGQYEKALEIVGDEYLMRYVEIFKYYESALNDAKKDVDFDDVDGNYRGLQLMEQCIDDIERLKEEYNRK